MNIDSKKQQQAAYNAPRRVHINDELGEPMYYGHVRTDEDPEGLKTRKPVIIPVYSSLSKRYRKAEADGRTDLLKAKGKARTDGEMSLKRESALVARCLDPWEGLFEGEDGDESKPYEFTHKNAVALLTAFPFIQKQLEDEMDNLEAFSGAASVD